VVRRRTPRPLPKFRLRQPPAMPLPLQIHSFLHDPLLLLTHLPRQEVTTFTKRFHVVTHSGCFRLRLLQMLSPRRRPRRPRPFQ